MSMATGTNVNAYPTWVEVVNTEQLGGGTAADRAHSGTPQGTLRELLGWRIDSNDPAAIQRALAETFPITVVDGKNVVGLRDSGFRTSAADGTSSAITGAQRSLYERAKAIIDQA